MLSDFKTLLIQQHNKKNKYWISANLLFLIAFYYFTIECNAHQKHPGWSGLGCIYPLLYVAFPSLGIAALINLIWLGTIIGNSEKRKMASSYIYVSVVLLVWIILLCARFISY